MSKRAGLSNIVCPLDGSATKVLDSGGNKAGTAVWRRRRCLVCGHRFSTREVQVRIRSGGEYIRLPRVNADGLALARRVVRSAPLRDQDGVIYEPGRDESHGQEMQ